MQNIQKLVANHVVMFGEVWTFLRVKDMVQSINVGNEHRKNFGNFYWRYLDFSLILCQLTRKPPDLTGSEKTAVEYSTLIRWAFYTYI